MWNSYKSRNEEKKKENLEDNKYSRIQLKTVKHFFVVTGEYDEPLFGKVFGREGGEDWDKDKVQHCTVSNRYTLQINNKENKSDTLFRHLNYTLGTEKYK